METYTTHIKSKTGWFDVNLKELWQYRDLIYMFARRSLLAGYKQTVLGPFWNVLQPLCTVAVQALVFGNMAKLSGDGVPKFVFYMCSNVMWGFFSTCLTKTAFTFTSNVKIMGKVYFPRLCMPLASTLLATWKMLIKVGLLWAIMLFYFCRGTVFQLGIKMLWAPLLLLQAAMLGTGFGVIVAAWTTKYRDLAVFISFGMQLWQYASPVIYTEKKVSAELFHWYMLNPIAPIMCNWRNVMLGSGTFYAKYWVISWIITVIVLLFGILVFNKAEKTFLDTI